MDDKSSLNVKALRAIIFGFSLFVGIILLVAATGKIFFPVPSFVILERFVGLFEVLFCLVIFFLRNRWQLWLAAAVIFAGWEGFAFYWIKVKLPCPCMGAMLPMPKGFAAILDLIFYFGSYALAALLGAKRKFIYLSLISSLLAGLIGFAFADLLLNLINKV